MNERRAIPRELEARRSASRVLIVDAGVGQAAWLARDLQSLGREVVGASTALEAVSWLESSRSTIATAIVDADIEWLDGLTGATLLDWIAVDYPEVHRVLACRPADGFLWPCEHALLSKPWNHGTLERAIAPLPERTPVLVQRVRRAFNSWKYRSARPDAAAAFATLPPCRSSTRRT